MGGRERLDIASSAAVPPTHVPEWHGAVGKRRTRQQQGQITSLMIRNITCIICKIRKYMISHLNRMFHTCGCDPRFTKHVCCAPPVCLQPPYDYVSACFYAVSQLAVAEKPHRDTQPFFGAGLHLRARVSTRIASAAQHTAAQHAHQHCRVIREQTLVVVLFTTDKNVHVPNQVTCYRIQLIQHNINKTKQLTWCTGSMHGRRDHNAAW